MEREVRLQVAEVKQQRDVGRCKARIGSKIMEKLEISTGDIIEIKGKKITAAIAWPAYDEDAGRNIIRIDGITRQNASVSINEYVTVRKANAKDAQHITLAPLNVTIPNVDEGFYEFIRTRIIEIPVVEDNVIQVPIFGNPVYFRVVKTRPHGIVRISPNTGIQILSEPLPEKKGIARVTYEDVGGLQEEIQRVREMVELPLKHPELFQRLGIEPPKGVLLHGPPGCGKTRLAQAVANESDANFFSINGPEIMSKFYGESEARLREIFQKAQESAPSIIFIDELDSIAPKREEVTGEVERRVVAQLLALMDGLESRGNIVVIGATNRPNALDPALRRPGRFDREIEIGIPDKNGRLEILQIHTRGMPLAEDVNLKQLAEITHGYTGADVAALCREAAMKALRRYMPEIDPDAQIIPHEILEKMEVRMEDFLGAYREVTPTALREVEIEVPTVRWEDIGGLEDVKQALREAVEWPLKRPDIFKRMGIKPPKGVLLYGPPGCGKTLLARAVATESEANFIAVKGPEVYSKWVGESERAIREIFRKARMAAPSIVFLDELDALAPARGVGYADSGVTERVVSQLLTELDGLTALENVLVLAATNRPDILDPALLRPGRFDRLIYIPAPDEKTRLEILRLYTKSMPLAKDVNLEELAAASKGFSGADIETLCREAAMNALRKNPDAQYVSMEDFNEVRTKMRPTITSEIENWYQNIVQTFKRSIRPSTPVT
ncbi:MAG: CDC48 family AAA ATPase [Candidatus Bathyarchaeia archaeon]